MIAASATANGVIIIPNSRVADLTEPSLVRVRGEVFGHDATLDARVSWGIIVLNRDHGATVPNPVSDGDADWLWWGTAGIVDVASGFGFDSAFRSIVDARAMRKLNEAEEVHLIAAANAGSTLLEFTVRWLLMQVGARR